MYSWDRTDLPHRGWLCKDMVDHGEPDFQCEMCGNPEVRYEHVMTHPTLDHPVGVGCVCAGHMEGDPEIARQRERAARKRVGRRETWVKSPRWKVSAKGNFWRKDKGVFVSVFRDPRDPSRWRVSIDETFGTLSHADVDTAKRAAWNRLNPKIKA